MRNNKFDRIKKTLAILLVLCFALSATAVSASASDNINCDENQYSYKDGYNKGSVDGKIQGQKDCEQYGSKDALSKIPSPHNEHGWAEYYRNNYNCGYEKGFIDSYNQIRYECLKWLLAISGR